MGRDAGLVEVPNPSALFLAAIGMLYGVMGTLNMADLAQKLRDASRIDLLTAIAMLFLVAFGIKAAVFPFFFWLPASYHTPPVAVSAIFAGLLTKVGVYVVLRTWLLFLCGLEIRQRHLEGGVGKQTISDSHCLIGRHREW